MQTYHSSQQSGRGVYRAGAWWAVALLGLCPVIAAAQEQPASTIKALEFRGLSRTNPAYARDIVGLREGDALDQRSLDRAVSRLLRTGKFLAARYEIVEEPGGVRIVFELRERRIVTRLGFDGNAKYRDATLAEHVGISVGDPVDRFAVRAGRDAIRDLYREGGYSDVVVNVDTKRLEDSGELFYVIEEGVRVRVKKIVFEGATVFPERELSAQIVTKTALGIFRAGDFDPDRVTSDAAILQKHYRDAGYLDARVSYRREVSDDGQKITLVFVIVEGVQYTIAAIEFDGNTVFADDELRDAMISHAGDTVRQPLIEQDARTIQSRYWELGHIYSSVRGRRVFSEDPGLVTVILQIDEGAQFKVGRIVVRGNSRTKDKVVRRALNLYPPDDLFDLNATREAERRLMETRIFDSARVYPVGDEPDRRDIVMDVQEAARSGDVVFGLGVTSNSGVVGTIVLDLQNFDIADTPRNWDEFTKFRSFFGAGQRMRIELQPGTEVSRFRIDFTEPYLNDKPLRFDFGGYVFQRGRDGYDEQRGGITVSLGKRYERGFLEGWSGEVALRLESVDVGGVDLFSSSEIRDDEGQNFLTSLKFSLVRDRTDNRFIPTTGDRLRFSYEQFGVLGGDFGFGRLTSSYTYYKTLRTDRLNRKSVLRLNAEGGAIAGEAPVFERFFAGGIGSVRGFRFRGIGEHDGLDDNNIGGDFLLLLGAEYAFPLFGDNVRGHVFLDTGTAGTGGYRASIGVGVRLTIDLLGPVPLEFNLAAPISSNSGDDEQVFSFIVGTLF